VRSLSALIEEKAPTDQKGPAKSSPWDNWLFALSLAVFLGTRVAGLATFPIFFFCDEAILNVRAAEFLHHGLRDGAGHHFPIYFDNLGQFNIGVSVYAQILPLLLFGRSIFVTRLTEVLVVLSGMVAVGLILKRILHVRFWWAGVLLLSITPSWFLHTRTAFGCAMAASYYAWFLYFYLRYRYDRPRYLFPCLLFGALSFYTYSAMQLVVVFSGILLFVSDLPFHWRSRKTVVGAMLFLVVLALPYAQFQREHAGDTRLRLRNLNSYWLSSDLTLSQKLAMYGKTYAYGLSPKYWYRPENPHDLVRHRMKGYGNILWITFPFAVIGVVVSLLRIRSSAHRVVLLAALAAPAGAALVEVLITRLLVFVVPVAILTTLGLSVVLSAVGRSFRGPWPAVLLFVVLAGINGWMLADALVHGPTWYDDYGLYGLQYGGPQVFGEVNRILKRSPDTRITVSHIWTNGTTAVQEFFCPGDNRIQLNALASFEAERFEELNWRLIVLTAPEYRQARANPLFADIQVKEILHYPNGLPGFYFMTMKYSEAADAIFAAQREERRRPVAETFVLGGEKIESVHSRFDFGSIRDLFDGDLDTLARVDLANPAIVALRFPTPRPIHGVTVSMRGEGPLRIRVVAGRANPAEFVFAKDRLGEDPTVSLDFQPAPGPLDSLSIEIGNPKLPPEGKLHIREIQLR
jgi:hypothetical protein